MSSSRRSRPDRRIVVGRLRRFPRWPAHRTLVANGGES
jgi:hypothetical protein